MLFQASWNSSCLKRGMSLSKSSDVCFGTVELCNRNPVISSWFVFLVTELKEFAQVKIPKPSNACFGFDDTTGWTFFDLNSLHDEYKDEPGTVVEADFVSAQT